MSTASYRILALLSASATPEDVADLDAGRDDP
jgi:hypothetical protein